MGHSDEWTFADYFFIVTGVCLKRQKGVFDYGNEQIGAH